MRKRELRYSDLRNGRDAIKYYGFNAREADQQIRKIMYGATQKELKQMHHEIFNKDRGK